MAEAGWSVVVADLDEAGAAAVAAEMQADHGVESFAHRVDISRADECERLVSAAANRIGEPTVLVNCAAYYRESSGLEMEVEEWAKVIDVDLNGTFYLSQAFARSLVAGNRAGCIVNIGSVSSTHSMSGKTAYGAAKAAVDSITRSLALEWGPLGIRVNAVAPSHTATETIKRLEEQGLLAVDQIVARIPLGRLAEPSEIADAVVFLCSDQARFITGQVLAVDGGYTANGAW